MRNESAVRGRPATLGHVAPTSAVRMAASLLLLAAACTGCSQTADINPVGNYRLVSIDGSTVPCTVEHGNVAITVKVGTFAINDDGTCNSRITFAKPSGSDFTRNVNARYVQDGATLNMKWEGAGKTTGTVQGDTFTMVNEGMTFAYEKQ